MVLGLRTTSDSPPPFRAAPGYIAFRVELAVRHILALRSAPSSKAKRTKEKHP